MKVDTYQIYWHDALPIYSADFEPSSTGRLATAGGDSNVRMWKVTKSTKSDDTLPRIDYLSTLNRHTAPVNVVRFAPTGGILASAGDDGSIILWSLNEDQESKHVSLVGNSENDAELERESWRVKKFLRGSAADIYDLAWSPDGKYIITGSIDNTARIWNVNGGTCLYVLAGHSHYVQGVAWDPLGKSVHIYSYQIQDDGSFAITDLGKNLIYKRDVIKDNSNSNDTTPDNSPIKQTQNGVSLDPNLFTKGENVLLSKFNAVHASNEKLGSHESHSSATTKTMNTLIAENSVFNNDNESLSPVIHPRTLQDTATDMVAESSLNTPPKTTPSKPFSKSFRMYCDETLKSFFRRLAFTPDGSLLLTPAALYRNSTTQNEVQQTTRIHKEAKNAVYLYLRNKLNKMPIACLKGFEKSSICVKCSPVLYKLRVIESSSFPSEIDASLSKMSITEKNNPSKFLDLPYRIIYAVATQDAVFIYDTQQLSPLAMVTNLHYATFTDVTWSIDGNILIIASADGFCSVLWFDEGELGEPYYNRNVINEKPKISNTITINNIPKDNVVMTAIDDSLRVEAQLSPQTNLSLVPQDQKDQNGTNTLCSPNQPNIDQSQTPNNQKRRIVPTLVQSLDI
ncbi:10998_t:CDS:2 [Ambispora leptoticha]|uniref:10998_t:CDS:1 n=1 Tax=Ambispora leptoticha TaxID=144679 RepID=A0A9N8V9A0_9GLOM|nr:10998_t:CDS:2 [Ambispora leptoticha]